MSLDKKYVEQKIDQISNILEKTKMEGKIGLLGGKTGLAMFYFYYAKFTNTQEPYDTGLEILSKIFDEINNGFNYHTHAGGLAGIGSILEILVEQDFIDADTNELLEGLDSYLYNHMMREIKSENYDFLHGAVGLALYFLKRKTNDSKKYLAEFIKELDKIATKDEEGIRWLSVLDHKNQTKGNNLSLSHGLASIIVVLSKIYKQGIEKEKTLELLNGSVKYLLNQQLDNNKFYSIFPSWVNRNEKPNNSRLAWCYGDLGMGIALWLAGNNTENKEWKDTAVEILLKTTDRTDIAQTGVVDAGLCHGAAGVAHIYNRMFKYTRIKEFEDAAEFWFNQTINMAIHKDSLSGYKVYRTEEFGGSYEDFGFLEGIAGIGLSLISAVSDIEPAWDECLLLS